MKTIVLLALIFAVTYAANSCTTKADATGGNTGFTNAFAPAK
jgi:hypothetical protein